jgi:heptosyltransferase III
MCPPVPVSSGKIVIIHQGALGDFLLTLPLLEALHRSNPLIRLDLWTRSEHIALLAENTYLGKDHPPDDSELVPFFHDELWNKARIPQFLLGAAAILIFGQAGSQLLADRLSRRLPCPVQWIQSFPGQGLNQHVHHFLLEQCRRLGWSVEECFPVLKPSQVEISLVQEYLRKKNLVSAAKPVLIHPGSGGVRKMWPLKRWRGLVRFLRGYDLRPLLMTLGPADEQLKGFAKEVENCGALVLEGISLPRLAAFLSECGLFIGSDSGVSHLAALIGIPTVVIFGPTNPGIWAPRGSHVHIIKDSWKQPEVLAWSPDLETIPPNSHLLEIVASLLSSSRHLL